MFKIRFVAKQAFLFFNKFLTKNIWLFQLFSLTLQYQIKGKARVKSWSIVSNTFKLKMLKNIKRLNFIAQKFAYIKYFI